jgi:hypothetical protein
MARAAGSNAQHLATDSASWPSAVEVWSGSVASPRRRERGNYTNQFNVSSMIGIDA